MRAVRTASLALLVVAQVAPARADEACTDVPCEPVDTTYGRINGDVAVVGAVGATFAPRGPRAALDLRARYLSTAGVFGTYEDATWLGSSADPRRVVATGVELRPLFLGRWLTGLEFGSPYLDLALDSIALEVGALWFQPVGAAFSGRPGLSVGLGVEIPILPHASGPLLGIHGGLRWSESTISYAAPSSALDRSAVLLVALGWQQVFGAHVVDVGDRAR